MILLFCFQYIFLDGDSLSTNDLRQLGQGRYKIKVTQERSYLSLNYDCFSYASTVPYITQRNLCSISLCYITETISFF
jgi:hypothetical protein